MPAPVRELLQRWSAGPLQLIHGNPEAGRAQADGAESSEGGKQAQRLLEQEPEGSRAD